MGEREILANAGIGADFTRCGVEHVDRRLRLPGKRQRKAVIRRIEHIAGTIEHGNRRVGFSLGDGHQGQLEHDLRLVRKQRQRVAIGALCRREPAATEIGIAEQGTEAGVVGRVADRALGERHTGRIITFFNCRLGASGDANVRAVDLVAEDRGAIGHTIARRGAGSERTDQTDSSQSGS